MEAPGVATRRRGVGWWFLVVVAIGSVVAYIVVVLQRIRYPYELTYFEGSTVEVAARVAADQPLYGPPTTQFTPWPYPPLYFWLTGTLMRVTGVDLTTMRAVSFTASLAVLVLLVLVVRRASASTVAGVVAAGLFAATYRVSGAFFDAARVDSLFLALLLAAILVGMRARTWRGGVGVGLVLFLGFLTKQNALVVAGPMVLWLLWRRRAVGASAAVTLAAGVVGSTVAGNLLTGGWYARYVLAQLPSQGWELRWLYDFWWQDLLLPFAVSVVVVLVLLLRSRGTRTWRCAAHHDVMGYLLAAATGLVLAAWVARLHEGGFANVAMPAHAAVCGVLGVLLAAWSARPATRTGWLAAVLLVQVTVMAVWQLDVVPSQQDRAAGDRFVATLRDLPGAVVVPTHPYYLRLAGRPTHASSIAVDDLYRASDGPEALVDVVPWSLGGVSAVVLDNATEARLFGDPLMRDFTLVTRAVVPTGSFLPKTDLPTHPALLYVRTSELNRAAVSPPP